MRLTRLVIGFLLILSAVLVISGEQLSGASADAVINARLTTIRAPIAGMLSVERRPLGTCVQEGEELGPIRDPIVDDIRLNDFIANVPSRRRRSSACRLWCALSAEW